MDLMNDASRADWEAANRVLKNVERITGVTTEGEKVDLASVDMAIPVTGIMLDGSNPPLWKILHAEVK